MPEVTELLWLVLSSTALSGGIAFAVARYLGRSATDSYFAKRLERFRADLNSEAEAQRFQFQRDLSNYALFAPAKHEAYRKIFRGYLVAEGAFAELSGLTMELDWPQVTLDDARTVLSDLELGQSFIERVLVEWDTDRPRAIVELRKAIRHAKVAKAQNAYVDFNNTRLEWALYCSANAARAIDEASDALAKLSAHYWTDPNSHKGVPALRKDVSVQAELLLKVLRAEIAVGSQDPS